MKYDKLKIYLQTQVEKGLNDREIGKRLNRYHSNVIYWRKKLGIKRQRKIENFELKEHLCHLINKEHPMNCLSDRALHRAISSSNPVSRRQLARIRQSLRIPPFRKTVEAQLIRQELYFKNGRVLWKPDGSHVYVKTNRNIFQEDP